MPLPNRSGYSIAQGRIMRKGDTESMEEINHLLQRLQLVAATIRANPTRDQISELLPKEQKVDVDFGLPSPKPFEAVFAEVGIIDGPTPGQARGLHQVRKAYQDSCAALAAEAATVLSQLQRMFNEKRSYDGPTNRIRDIAIQVRQAHSRAAKRLETGTKEALARLVVNRFVDTNTSSKKFRLSTGDLDLGSLIHSTSGRQDVLRTWFEAHLSHPYPDTETRRSLALECGMDEQRVGAWIGNARSRYKRACEQQGRPLPWEEPWTYAAYPPPPPLPQLEKATSPLRAESSESVLSEEEWSVLEEALLSSGDEAAQRIPLEDLPAKYSAATVKTEPGHEPPFPLTPNMEDMMEARADEYLGTQSPHSSSEGAAQSEAEAAMAPGGDSVQAVLLDVSAFIDLTGIDEHPAPRPAYSERGTVVIKQEH